MADEMLWSGRFEQAPERAMLELTASLAVDLRLLPYDVAATKAHARALAAAGLLEERDLGVIDEALDRIAARHAAGELAPTSQDEDVHSLVERLLTEDLGELGARIHAGRSRNDLVATDLRLYCKDAAGALIGATVELTTVLCDLAERHAATLMPGYTHLQRAQPVSLGFHLLAHGFALERCAARFAAAQDAADTSPLGAGALAGTTLGIDPAVAAKVLGFARTFANALDATATRDFAWDLVYACAACAVVLSRFAEEVVLWCSDEFAFARPSDAWSTGSSMMPNKRNPDMAELARGRAAVTIGALAGLLGLEKGLALGYGRDLQEDKELVFGAVDRTLGALRGLAGLAGSLVFDEQALAAAATGGAVWATDVAEALVARGVPFRSAHAAAGRLVAELERAGLDLADAPVELLASVHPALRAEDRAFADPARGLAARRGPGGPAPERVAEQAAALRARLAARRQ